MAALRHRSSVWHISELSKHAQSKFVSARNSPTFPSDILSRLIYKKKSIANRTMQNILLLIYSWIYNHYHCIPLSPGDPYLARQQRYNDKKVIRVSGRKSIRFICDNDRLFGKRSARWNVTDERSQSVRERQKEKEREQKYVWVCVCARERERGGRRKGRKGRKRGLCLPADEWRFQR